MDKNGSDNSYLWENCEDWMSCGTSSTWHTTSKCSNHSDPPLCPFKSSELIVQGDRMLPLMFYGVFWASIVPQLSGPIRGVSGITRGLSRSSPKAGLGKGMYQTSCGDPERQAAALFQAAPSSSIRRPWPLHTSADSILIRDNFFD